MPDNVSDIWVNVPADIRKRLDRRLDSAVAHTAGPVTVFFRADDIGVPGGRFSRLVDLFMKNRMPLNTAVVPAWLTAPRWQALEGLAKEAPDLLCWHQHGWRHVNYQVSGKNQEFGPTRTRTAIAHDLLRGRKRLTHIMDREFCPVFTPPWNRCDSRTLELLKKWQYGAVSRSRASVPAPPKGLREFSIHVDLHTSRNADPLSGWHQLLRDLESSIVGQRCGIMIHHQKMNGPAFDFLDILLKALGRRKQIRTVTFREMIDR